MNTTLAEARAELVAALETAVGSTPVFDHLPESIATECYVIAPASPYLTPDGEPFGHYRARFNVLAVADVGPNEYMTRSLDALIVAALGVLDAEEISEPYAFASVEAIHLAADITVSTTIKP